MNSRLFRFRYLTTQAISLAGTQTGRIQGHQASTRLYDEALWTRFHEGARQAFPTLYREGRHTAYGLVYTRATRPLIDPRTVLMVRRSEGMSMKLAKQLLTGER